MVRTGEPSTIHATSDRIRPAKMNGMAIMTGVIWCRLMRPMLLITWLITTAKMLVMYCLPPPRRTPLLMELLSPRFLCVLHVSIDLYLCFYLFVYYLPIIYPTIFLSIYLSGFYSSLTHIKPPQHCIERDGVIETRVEKKYPDGGISDYVDYDQV